MYILSSTSDAIKAQLSEVSTSGVDFVSSWRDVTSISYTPGRSASTLYNTSLTSIIGSPAASVQRVIDNITIFNHGNLQRSGLTVYATYGGEDYAIWKGRLYTDESARYIEHDGWRKLNALGERAEAGPRGEVGAPGVSGISITGPQGEQGAPGVSGISIQGPQGEPGVSGINGINGINGIDGAPGVSGISFIWRNTWDIATNYLPNDVVFVSGSSYINLSAATGIEPPAAEWSLMSQRGTDGSNGADGAPGVSGISIQGPQGEPGVSGISIQGPAGPQGPAGIYPASLHTTVSGICYAVLNDNKANFDFPGRTTASFVILRPTNSHGISGILSTDIPVGWVMFIHNNSTYTPSLNHDGAGSDAANRFYLPGATGIVMGAYATVPLIRTCLDADGAGTTIRWVALAW